MVRSKRNEVRVHACPCYLSSRKKESDKNDREKVDIVLSQVIFFFGGGGGGGLSVTIEATVLSQSVQKSNAAFPHPH